MALRAILQLVPPEIVDHILHIAFNKYACIHFGKGMIYVVDIRLCIDLLTTQKQEARIAELEVEVEQLQKELGQVYAISFSHIQSLK